MRADPTIAPAAGAPALIVALPRLASGQDTAARAAPRGIAALPGVWWRRWRARREMLALARFAPDEILRDIGVSREEAWRRARTPVWKP